MFNNLSRADQLRAIRPHLLKLIRDEYAPALQRADMFFGAAKDREKLKLPEYMCLGDIPSDETVNLFLPELRRWALRGERWEGQVSFLLPSCSDS
jgi:hypothetical protein